MPNAPRQDWGIGTSKAHIAIMRAAPPDDLPDLARSYDWTAHPEPVLGWVMAQKSVDLGTAITVFFQGGPERFNYLSKKSVPRCHAPVVRLLDNICLRINCGFYLPHPDGAPAEAVRLISWMAAQKADRAEGSCGRWVLDEEVLARVAPMNVPPSETGWQPAAPVAQYTGWRARLNRLLASGQKSDSSRADCTHMEGQD